MFSYQQAFIQIRKSSKNYKFGQNNLNALQRYTFHKYTSFGTSTWGIHLHSDNVQHILVMFKMQKNTFCSTERVEKRMMLSKPI